MIFHTPVGGKFKLGQSKEPTRPRDSFGGQPIPGPRPGVGGSGWCLLCSEGLDAPGPQWTGWVRGGGAGQQPVPGLRDGSEGHTRRYTRLLGPRPDALCPPGPDGARFLSRSGAQTALGAAHTARSTWESPGGSGRGEPAGSSRSPRRGPGQAPGWGWLREPVSPARPPRPGPPHT